MSYVVVTGGKPEDYAALVTRFLERIDLPSKHLISFRVVADVGDVLRVEATFLVEASDAPAE